MQYVIPQRINFCEKVANYSRSQESKLQWISRIPPHLSFSLRERKKNRKFLPKTIMFYTEIRNLQVFMGTFYDSGRTSINQKPTSGSWHHAWYDIFEVVLSIIVCHSISPSFPLSKCKRCIKSFSVTISCSLSSALLLGQ